MEYVLGIDIGTGSTKAVAVNFNSEPFAVSQQHYPTCSPKPGYSEQDPELIWNMFRVCLGEILNKMRGAPKAICFSSAMHSVIPVDKHGNKLCDMLTWADCRSDAIASRLRSLPDGANAYESSGMPLHAMSPLCKIIWFRENRTALFNQTFKFISIKEYIWYKLFGEYVVDHSIAGATGMLDISTMRWNSHLLSLAGINEHQLSMPVSTSYFLAAPSLLGVLESETTFIIGSSDGCLANLGSYALRKGIAALTVGTSGAVRISSSKPIVDKVAMTFSYRLDENKFICGGPVNNGGNVLQWLSTNFLGKASDKQTFEELFASIDQVPPGADGLLFLPYLHGERAPIWDANSSGAFVGIRSTHTQAHFCRAVLEGVCFALNDVLLAVENKSEHIEQINVSGGFVNSLTWMQLLADISGKRLAVWQTEDASAVGAAFMALKVLGLNSGNYPAEPQNGNQITIEPDRLKHIAYGQNFQIFKGLYLALKESMHQLNLTRS
jgi:gluconokinase